MIIAKTQSNVLQNFLKDLLQRAKKPYDEKKLEEYTLTTVGELLSLTSTSAFCLILPKKKNFFFSAENFWFK